MSGIVTNQTNILGSSLSILISNILRHCFPNAIVCFKSNIIVYLIVPSSFIYGPFLSLYISLITFSISSFIPIAFNSTTPTIPPLLFSTTQLVFCLLISYFILPHLYLLGYIINYIYKQKNTPILGLYYVQQKVKATIFFFKNF